jgi:hypothetical protein
MTEIFSFKAIIAAFLSVWARSAILFWSLAVCCLVVFIALVAGAHWQLGDAPVLLAAYGTILVLTFLVLFVLAAFTTYSERPPPTLSLLPQEGQSFCGQSRQPDGRITTQLELRFQATNLTGGAILLSALELRRPFVRRRGIPQTLNPMIHFWLVPRRRQVDCGKLGSTCCRPLPRSLSLVAHCHPVQLPAKRPCELLCSNLLSLAYPCALSYSKRCTRNPRLSRHLRRFVLDCPHD